MEFKIYTQNQIPIGIDEAGRGPLAGPVVAAAVWVNPAVFKKDFPLKKFIRDSKKLSEKKREEVFRFMEKSEDFVIGRGEVSHTIIDRINILNAALLAMRLAAEEILERLEKEKPWQKQGAVIWQEKEKKKIVFGNRDNVSNISFLQKACLLIDGNKKIPGIKINQRIFPQGDARIFSIAAASICAKVWRDKVMREYHQQYSGYGFDRHKGYGTRLHLTKLKELGPCKIHRQTFGPVKRFKSS